MTVQSAYQKAVIFAATKHLKQTIPGTDLPYIIHVGNVAMEVLVAAHHSNDFNVEVAVQIALLHDTMEDSTTSYDELKNTFGEPIAKGVEALTKNESFDKKDQMTDSLNRIKTFPKEVWIVKLADRITNLQAPPKDWDINKRTKYMEESKNILNELKEGNNYLATRLNAMIEAYAGYMID